MSNYSSPELTMKFISAFREHPAGVAVVTAIVGNTRAALTATSVSSISADPPRLVFSLSDASSSAPIIKAASTAVVHLLSVENEDLARLCSTSNVDRFADRSLWGLLPTGEPYYLAVPIRLRVAIEHRLEVDGATLIIARALDVDSDARLGSPSLGPLVYHQRSWHTLTSA